MDIPLVDLKSAMGEIIDDLIPDVARVLRSASFIGGPDVDDFEREYADFVGVDHCIGVGNGTDALELALRAIDVTGKEVILPANSFIATAEAVVRAGGLPILVDVNPDTLLIDPECVADALTARTRAIIPVHLFGQMAPMDEIIRIAADVGAVVLEDAAQSQGATSEGRVSGSVGLMGATSFYPGKNLGAAGDAGAVTTNDPELARAVRLLGAHGSERKYIHETVGFNSRLDTLQAVVLRHKLRRLAVWNKTRAHIAERYSSLLTDLDNVIGPVVAPHNQHVWHLYVVRVPDRDRVLGSLHKSGVGAGVHYPIPIHLTPAFAGLGYGAGTFPIAEGAASTMLSLPIHPHLTGATQDLIVDRFQLAIRA